jgi:hypothetical protein
MTRIRRRVRRTMGMIILLALGVAGAGILAGCGGNSSSASSSTSAGRQAPAAQGNAGVAQSGSTATSSKTDVGNTADLIVMAGLQLAVKDPEQAAGRAEQDVVAAGGYVAGEAEGVGTQVLPSVVTTADSSESTDTGVSPVTLPAPDAAANSDEALLLVRVPPAKLDAVLAELAGSGDVAYRTRSATDVTGQVADVNSRIASAQSSIAELRGMIDKAASMNDLISLEQALATRESDLESLEAQQRALADQTAYATVTVGYYEPAVAATVKPAPHQAGFLSALNAGWHALLAVFRVIVIGAGWVLPFAVLIALLWWPVRRARRLTWWSRRPGHRTE